MKYLKVEVVELPDEQVARFEVAISLATSPKFDKSDLREDILKRVCKKDKSLRKLIEKFRKENQ
jgi:hypothetical protein